MHPNPCNFRYFTMATNCRITVSSVYSLDNTGLPSNVTCSVSVVDTGSLSDTSTLVIRIGKSMKVWSIYDRKVLIYAEP